MILVRFISSVGPYPGAELMLWNEQGQTNNYINSYEEISIPAGLSHRLKPARRAALAVEKVTAVGRLQEAGRVAGAVSLRSYLVLEKRAMLFSSQSHNVVLWNNHILGI